MKSALQQIARQIDTLLAADDYPAAIAPEYLAAAVREYPLRGGKRLRPALLLWCVGAMGGDPGAGLYPAAALEVFHNWTLVHDDIIDADATRRGVPTEHIRLREVGRERFKLAPGRAAKFGCDMAMLAGDLQQGWVTALLLKAELSAEMKLALLSRLNLRGYVELVSGEALDVEFSVRELGGIATPELERMLYGKTAAIFRLAAEAGAAIGLNRPDFDAPPIRALGDFATATAVAFQLRDDWLGIFGDATFGKPIGSDLSERKATPLLLKTLAGLDAEGSAELTGLLGRERYSEAELERVRGLMTASGAVAELEREEARLVALGTAALAGVPENGYRRYLAELAEFLVRREV